MFLNLSLGPMMRSFSYPLPPGNIFCDLHSSQRLQEWPDRGSFALDDHDVLNVLMTNRHPVWSWNDGDDDANDNKGSNFSDCCPIRSESGNPLTIATLLLIIINWRFIFLRLTVCLFVWSRDQFLIRIMMCLCKCQFSISSVMAVQKFLSYCDVIWRSKMLSPW